MPAEFLRSTPASTLHPHRSEISSRGQRQSVHCPLPLLWPSTSIVKLDNLRAIFFARSPQCHPCSANRRRTLRPFRAETKHRGKFRASLRTGTITLTGTGAGFAKTRVCLNSSSSCIDGGKLLPTYYPDIQLAYAEGVRILLRFQGHCRPVEAVILRHVGGLER